MQIVLNAFEGRWEDEYTIFVDSEQYAQTDDKTAAYTILSLLEELHPDAEVNIVYTSDVKPREIEEASTTDIPNATGSSWIQTGHEYIRIDGIVSYSADSTKTWTEIGTLEEIAEALRELIQARRNRTQD